jgi:eukaryotic-like serine/threonine-protein kinase
MECPPDRGVSALAASFVKKRRLGSGQFGEVWLAFDTGLAVDRAVKIIPLSKVVSVDNFYQEAQILRAVTHNHVVRVEEAGRLSDDQLYIAMEYLPLGSVEDEARGAPLPMTRAVRVLCDALKGLEHVHSQGVIHRDIKPGNILVGDLGQCKLSDFGLAAKVGATGATSPEGYLYHAAPEIVRDDAASVLTDVYAAGVTLYRLLNGDDLLPTFADFDDYLQAIGEGRFPDRGRHRLYVPRSLRVVTNRAMHIDPSLRYCDARAFRVALEQVRICCDWQEEPISTGTLWRGVHKGAEVQVVMTVRSRGKVVVETKRRTPSGGWRRVKGGCDEGLTLAEARRVASGVLQALTAGRLPS